MDLEHLELIHGVLFDEGLKESRMGLLFKVSPAIPGKPWPFVLFEHKSDPRGALVQTHKYSTLIYQETG